MKKIKLKNNKFALVDNDMFSYLNRWKWYVNENGYAIRRYKKTIRMHRLVNKTPYKYYTDHINRNKLDNRRINLRTVTKSQNAFNTKLNSNNKSGYKGIYWDKFTNKWRAEIKLNYKKISLGRYSTLKGARIARIWGERLYHEI